MYTIITDSCSDLLPAYHKDYEDFLVLPLEFTLDGNTYENVPDCEISSKQFYDKLRSGSMSTTSKSSAVFSRRAGRRCTSHSPRG